MSTTTSTESFVNNNVAASADVGIDENKPITSQQFRLLFLRAAIPMIGFGIMDQLLCYKLGMQ